MNDLEYQELMEQSWKRGLTPVEEGRMRVFLEAHPEMRPEWEREAGLNRLLEQLLDAPVPTNFTTRVMQAVQREDAKRSSWIEKISAVLRRGHGWLPRVAIAGLVVCAGLLSVHEYQVANRRQFAHDVAEFGQMATLPKIEWLKDFETINRLSKVQVADTELLAVLE